jgi:hypothetical protein
MFAVAILKPHRELEQNAFHCLETFVTCVKDHVQHQFMLPNLGNLFRAWIGAKNDLSVNF